MFIECPYDKAIVDAKVIKSKQEVTDEGVWELLILECSVCRNIIVAERELYAGAGDNVEYGPLERSWPYPDEKPHWRIPERIRNSLNEACKSYKCGAYDACAVMIGRTLEGICREFNTQSRNLEGRLKELLHNGVIDNRIFEWGDELRRQRNIGAHDSEEKITKVDAHDLLDFANAICDYIFVLTAKFNEYKARKNKTV